ncbi:MAG TPA: hypothetical protein VJ714_00180, partial [Anaerolineae bacterium]|nr:hypothetical protein [Anaerolineae bacterium]
MTGYHKAVMTVALVVALFSVACSLCPLCGVLGLAPPRGYLGTAGGHRGGRPRDCNPLGEVLDVGKDRGAGAAGEFNP